MTKFIARQYNSFEVDKKTNSILVKKSKDKKLLDEARYYNNLPKELSVFFPRIYSSNTSEDGIHQINLEYYAYSNLGEKLIDKDWDLTFWDKALNFLVSYII